MSPTDWNDGIVGRQLLGFPRSSVTAVAPTADYLSHGPVGDGWYVPSEDRYVTTDFLVTVRLADGREIQLPKSYAWVNRNKTTNTEGCLS